ncbi:YidH family protein [Profundibacter sp.]
MKNPHPDDNALALDRTVLANERTFQAWIRTGLSALAAGLGIAKFLQDTMPQLMLLALATAMILLSILAFLQASWRYTHLHIRMVNLEVDATPTWMVKAISFSLVGCSLLALISVFLLASH